MRKLALAILTTLTLTSVANAQMYYPAGGYYGVPYTGGYLATFGGPTVVVSQPVVQVVPQVVIAQPVAVIPVTPYRTVQYVRPRCPSGLAPTPRPLYDAYGSYLGQSLICY